MLLGGTVMNEMSSGLFRRYLEGKQVLADMGTDFISKLSNRRISRNIKYGPTEFP